MKRYNITVNGTAYDVSVEEVGASDSAPVAAPAATAPKAAPAAAPSAAGGTKVECPMPGTVISVKANVGDVVKKGAPIIVLEAMKMENDISAPCDGTVASINVHKGDSVTTGAVIATIKA